MARPTVDSTVGHYPGWGLDLHMAPPAPGFFLAPPYIYSALTLWTMALFPLPASRPPPVPHPYLPLLDCL